MSTAALSRAPSQPRAETEHPNPRGPSGPSSTAGPQGLNAPSQDPGHPHLVTRPVFYIHAPPPPPPFMHYQWPMPFYSPFTPFSGMGYGMMMPPFPPAPYMEPPAYFFPHHAPMQPMDYRRMVHPQPHPNGAPYPAQARRPRPPQSSQVRETVNSEVQTDPREGYFLTGSPLRSCADSGRGTAPSSPTSSTSSNQKNSYNNVESSSQAKEGSKLPIVCPRVGIEPGLQTHNPGERQIVQKIAKENRLVKSPSLKSRNLHLVRQENVETVETPAKDVSNKERRVSVPDILMSWSNGTPQEEAITKDVREKPPSYEDEVANFQSSTVVNEELLDAETVDSDKGENGQIVDPKSCEEPCENSLNLSSKAHNAGLDTVNEATLGELLESAQTPSKRKKFNESIWSVESIPGFVPTKEWLAQNTTMGADIIVETAEEIENGSSCEETQIQKNCHNSSNNSMQKLCEEPCENSLDISSKARNAGLDIVNEPTLEEPSESAQTPSKRKKFNESVWSVESIPGFVPTKEWLAQNKTMGAEIIVETAEEVENGSSCDEMQIRESCHNSLNDSVQMSDSFIGFSTPTSKETIDQANEPVVYKLKKFMNPLGSPIYVKNKSKEIVKDIERKEASEPEGNPRNKSFTMEEKVCGVSNKDKTVFLEVAKGRGEECSQKKVPEAEVQRLLVPLPLHVVTEVSPSKVDFGVQCPEQRTNRGKARMNRKYFHKSADFLNTSTLSEGYYGNGPKKRNFPYRNKDRQDVFHPYMDRPGKARGGKGRY